MRAAPWKSGALAPRKAPKSARASAPVVAFCARSEFFRSHFSRATQWLGIQALASEGSLVAPAEDL